MKTRAEESNPESEIQFELKYCERCGGLWLRPTGGGQIYCTACAQAMAELPPVSQKPGGARVPQGPRWDAEEDGFDPYADEEADFDAPGGVA
jgi:hypothetical protein